MSIASDLAKITHTLPDHVKLVAVSKTKPIEAIMEAYGANQRIFGENKVQEMVDKYEQLPKDIEWHFIGHLQTNKVKYLAPFVTLLHGVDSFKLLKVINREAEKNGRIINCLLQFKIAEESTKFGLTEAEASEILTSKEYQEMRNIRIMGVMGMATYTSDTEKVRAEFRKLSSIFNSLKTTYFKNYPEFKEISMGMSHDYKLAIAEGATIVRVGSSIFGERIYSNH